jgi:uncharacterized protein
MNKKKRSEINPKCLRCQDACCRYLTVGIPAPRSILDFDNLIWMLHHKRTTVFKDSKGWYLLINNPCSHLKVSGGCAIYEKRPKACREHSAKECEYDGSIEEASILYFNSSRSLEEYCKKRFKRWDKRHESGEKPKQTGN